MAQQPDIDQDNNNYQNNGFPIDDVEKKKRWSEYLKGYSKWLIEFIIILIIVVIIYFALHILIKGAKNETISDADFDNITSIIKNENSKLQKVLPDTTKLGSSAIFTQLYIDSANSKIKIYFSEKYRNRLSSDSDADNILKIKNFDEMNTVIRTLTITVKSFFWLNDDKKYIEVIFWAWFGVLCSILYYCSEFLKQGAFKLQEVPVYWAKLFYAPIITVIIVFGYKSFTSSGFLFNDTSYGLFFFSFVLGFFSGRAIELLNKIKDTVIPASPPKSSQTPTSPPTSSQIPGEPLPHSISGTVTISGITPTGDEIKNVNVVLTSLNDKKSSATHPDAKGVYKFTNLKQGKYNLEASLTIGTERYENKTPIEIELKDKSLERDITLTKI